MEHDHVRDPVTGRCEMCDSRKIRGYGYNFDKKRGSVNDLSGKNKFKSAAHTSEFVNRLIIDREPSNISPQSPSREPTNLRPASAYKRRGSTPAVFDNDTPEKIQNGGTPGAQNDIFITINGPDNSQPPPSIVEIPPTPATPRTPTPPTPPPQVVVVNNKRVKSPSPPPTPRRGSKTPQVIVVNVNNDEKQQKKPETPEPEVIYVQEEREKPKPKPTVIRKKFEPPPTQEIIYVEDEIPQKQTVPNHLSTPRKSIVVVKESPPKPVVVRPVSPNPKYPVTTLKLGNRVDPYTKSYGRLYSTSNRSHLNSRGRGRCLCCCLTSFLIAGAIAGLIAGILYMKEMSTFEAQLPQKRYYWVVPDCETNTNGTTAACAVTKIVNAATDFTVPSYITTTKKSGANTSSLCLITLFGNIVFIITFLFAPL